MPRSTQRDYHDMLETHVEAAAQTIQNQFAAMTKLIDQRVDANKEQSDVRFGAVESRLEQHRPDRREPADKVARQNKELERADRLRSA